LLAARSQKITKVSLRRADFRCHASAQAES
jgi:hypothetical protein